MEHKPPRITFWSGVGEVTGANFLLEYLDERILVDCGLIQGKNVHKQNWEKFPYDPSSIDYLFITHAHIDHIGRIPFLLRKGFNGEIWSTPQTKELAPHMLRDALYIATEEAHRDGSPVPYEEKDIDEALRLWKTAPYYEVIYFGEWSVLFKDAGHILGSAMPIFSIGGKNIAFTGDLGNSPTPLLRDTDFLENIDYLVMESVYGDRNHEGLDTRRDKLQEIIIRSIERGGTLLIPCFSLERTQILLHELNHLVERNSIPKIPVFLDSPLAIRVTEIYRREGADFNKSVQKEQRHDRDIFDFPNLNLTLSRRDSAEIAATHGPKIIIAGSGMSEGGRVRGHEKAILSDDKNTILFIGYQGIGTLGRRIMDGERQIVIDGTTVGVRANIESILGYSSHKDSDHLIEFVEKALPIKQVFVVMGEPKASLFLVQKLRDELVANAIYPERGKSYLLE
ncbi:MAG: hypothetical protein A2928_00940 [Candidatus Taylorbacteria bacterium RIFCSPLOWO2_01_FULL_45_15b]|uniref:MBL fold hydrolase n=1 Tax=Candidatus Taylorbacteria bacterium RIFCSPLOWO2_01_FULL_45_15b TaxID=1802319 RepID=A0A1G2NA95_9BACT|nr:MAG: hypothetical protein A2928_00940 [Candidatus Taylorbacteria bacterium RIFCSPLOWO2_01_FULL_45_15b]